MLRFGDMIFCHFPTCLYRIQLGRIRRKELYFYAWRILLEKAFDAQCLVIPYVIKKDNILIPPWKLFEKVPEKMLKSQAVFRLIKVIIEMMVTCQGAKGNKLLVAPKEGSTRSFSSWKPNLFVRRG